MKKNRLYSFVLNALALAALGFLLTASDCHNQVSITPPVNQEICNDGIDNDLNGLTDCRDSYCVSVCKPVIAIFPISSPVIGDTLQVTGTCLRAQNISLSLAPTGAGQGGAADIVGNAWSKTLTGLGSANGKVLTAIATDSTGLLHDTATATFDVQ